MALTVSANAWAQEGVTGSLLWGISDGVLTIRGIGPMPDYNAYNPVPWENYIQDVTSIEIEYGVTSIGLFAFENSINVTSVTIPNSVKSINSWAFSGCSMESVTIPNSVTNIGDYSFVGCENLKSITIPNSVTSIGEGAFTFCTGLTSVSIGSSVEIIKGYVFSFCPNISTVKVFWNNPSVCWLFEDIFDSEIMASCTLNVPVGTKEIYQNATFWGDFNVIEATLEDDISIEPQLQTTTITWLPIKSAAGYTLIVYNNADYTQVFCIIYFNANGTVKNVLFRSSSAEEYYSYTIENLKRGTTYYYELSANDASDKILDTTRGAFTTLGTSSVENITADSATVVGYYSLTGVKLAQEPTNGIYIILYNNGKTKKIMK